MEEKFADKYRVKSSRRESWDYGSKGLYFLTICTLNGNLFFGKVANKKMVYSKIGLLVYKNLIRIPIYFNNIELIDYVIMPNHVHILLEIKYKILNKSRDAINRVSTKNKRLVGLINKNPMKVFTIGTVIRWFKAKSSTMIRKEKSGFGWQSGYYDEIIEDDVRTKIVRKYISNNYKNWEKDKFYLL